MGSDKIVLCVRIDEDYRILLEITCRMRYRSVSECIRDLIKKYVREHEDG